MDPLIVLFGLGVGILVGLTGIGGGSLMTPLLLLVGGYSPVVAIGTDLAYGAITKTVGGWRHLRAGHVDLRLSWWLAAGSRAGLDHRRGRARPAPRHLRRGLRPVPARVRRGGAGASPPARRCYRAMFRPDMHRRERKSAGLKRRSSKVATVVIGLVLGIVLGMTSVGSRRARRARADPALPAQAAPRRRHRRLPRRRDAVERRPRAPGDGNVDLGLMADDPRRLDPRRLDRHGAAALRAGRRPAPHARDRAHRGRARRALEGRRADVAVRARRDPAGAGRGLGRRAPAPDAADR